MKVCSKCSTEKPLTEYQKDSRSKTGFRSSCKECANASVRAYREANPEKIAEQKKEYWVKASEAEKPKRAARYTKNKDREIAKAMEYHFAPENPTRIIERMREYNITNREDFAAYRRAHRAEINAARAVRRAKKLNATPSWADLKAMEIIYERARDETQVTGVVMHVDHIVPLVSDIVCGLHVPGNLEVITGKANLSKGNRTWPDMP